jgi:endonuclease YncB( thermonuclease family)
MILGKLLLVVLAVALAVFVVAKPLRSVVRGEAVVLDSDTLRIGETTVDLWGVDGLEFAQQCFRAGEAWNCGAFGYGALLVRTHGATVWCLPRGERQNDRVTARCFVGWSDLATHMTKNGWAVADPRTPSAYANAIRAAQQAKRGAWSSEFESPSTVRASRAVNAP